MSTTRVLLADDHDIVRRGVRDLIEAQQGFEICGEASTGREAVEQAKKLKPNIVMMDMTMPDMNGLEATRQIRKALPNTEVLIFTMHETDQLVQDILAAGARGYVLKSDAAKSLMTAIEALREHKPFFSPNVSEAILAGYLDGATEQKTESPAGPLSPREYEIVQLLAEGKSNKDVADKLGISVKTVETHRAAIMRKLNLHSIAELVRYAIRNNIVQP